MNLKIRVIGPDIILKQEITLALASQRLKDVTRALLEQNRAEWERIIQDDFSPSERYEILVKAGTLNPLKVLIQKSMREIRSSLLCLWWADRLCGAVE